VVSCSSGRQLGWATSGPRPGCGSERRYITSTETIATTATTASRQMTAMRILTPAPTTATTTSANDRYRETSQMNTPIDARMSIHRTNRPTARAASSARKMLKASANSGSRSTRSTPSQFIPSAY
jgi:hypothetical protein